MYLSGAPTSSGQGSLCIGLGNRYGPPRRVRKVIGDFASRLR